MCVRVGVVFDAVFTQSSSFVFSSFRVFVFIFYPLQPVPYSVSLAVSFNQTSSNNIIIIILTHLML